MQNLECKMERKDHAIKITLAEQAFISSKLTFSI